MISRKKSLTIVGAIGVLLVSGALLAYYASSIIAYAHSLRTLYVLSTLEDQEYQTYFVSKIGDINRIKGVNGMVDLVLEDFEKGRITMFECHSLAHDLGHYGGYTDNFSHSEDYITKRNLDFCGSGFLHGVEGQLANNPYPQNAELLYEFCKQAMPFEPFYRSCYHGAGHAFMENTRDPLLAVAECDTLITDPELVPDVSSCYRGVFSEHSDYMHEEGKSKAEVLQFCADLPPQFHTYCAEELNGLHLYHSSSREEMDEALRLCAEGPYSDVIKLGCAQSVSGVMVDLLLGRNEEMVMPAWAFNSSEAVQKAIINGAVGTLRKNGTEKALANLKTFCETMATPDLRNYCDPSLAL